MTVVIVGEAPNRDGMERPFDSRTRSGRRLAELLGVEEVADAFAVVNLVDRWPGHTSHGTAFPAGLARSNAEHLWRELPGEARLLLVGQRVARAFGVGMPYLRWIRLHTTDCEVRETKTSTSYRSTVIERPVAILPHPSGVNRWWNDPAHHAAAARFARSLKRYA